jgi:1-acyl-sn-glycerol-3-phosphate acyltransferase
VSCLVKVEAFTPLMGALLRSCGHIPVRRDGGDASAVRQCLRILHSGGSVGIFPEGTRGHGLVETAKLGVGYLASRSGATVIPVACSGTSEMAHRHGRRRPPAVLIGEPIVLNRWPDAQVLKRGVAAAATEGIRVALAPLVDHLEAGRGRGRTTTTTTERARD